MTAVLQLVCGNQRNFLAASPFYMLFQKKTDIIFFKRDALLASRMMNFTE